MVNTKTTNRHGHSLWLTQRFSALVMIAYSVMAIIIYLTTPIHSFTEWKALFNSTLFNIAWLKIFTLLFSLSLFVHAWIGVSDVVSDYISNLKLRFTLQKTMELALCGYTFWSFWVLWYA
jgi:succinate dehydrogenase / fumarate reductase membrane anchor subunit